MQHPFFSITFAGLLLVAQAPQAEPILDCVPKGNARPICEFKNPEDMVALPGGQAILIGEYGGSPEVPGGLLVFELESEKQHTVFRGGQGNGAAESGWGDPNCATPPGKAFNAHGMGPRSPGRWAVAAAGCSTRQSRSGGAVRGDRCGCRLARGVAWLCAGTPPRHGSTASQACPTVTSTPRR